MVGIISPAPRIRILAQSSAIASLTGSTSETVLATIPIPGGIIGLNGRLRVRALMSHVSSANSKALRVRLGGLTGQSFGAVTVTTTTVTNGEWIISNRNSLSSQFAVSFGNRSIDLLQSVLTTVGGTIDTSVAQDLVLTGQLGSAAETITLEMHEVELRRM